MYKPMRPPRAEWSLIGDSFQISANKLLLVWNKKTQAVELAMICHSESPGDGGTGDPRGDLLNEDHTRRLDWDDYCHYCYVACPIESGADKGLAVYVAKGDGFVKVYDGPSHAHNTAAAVCAALRLAGHEPVQKRDGNPPGKRKAVGT